MSSSLRLAAVFLLLLSGPALAHTGHDHGSSFLAGFTHPLFGWDHLLAMVAVGLWAGISGGRALWAWPLAFVLGMSLGGLLGLYGVALPAVEHAILFSVLALGLATLFALRLPVSLGALLVVALATTHGNAHGLEAPANGDLAEYAAGFLLSTALLHAAGLGIALATSRGGAAWIARALGLGVALGGVVLAVG